VDARVLSVASSHIGRVRATNQDSGYAGTHLFLVADGMGGHAGGDVASSLATQAVTAVADDGHSRVDVNSGEVLVHLSGSDASHRLRQGEMMAVEPGDPSSS
jgi:serine/threonine protein phosphatase PrpC